MWFVIVKYCVQLSTMVADNTAFVTVDILLSVSYNTDSLIKTPKSIQLSSASKAHLQVLTNI